MTDGVIPGDARQFLLRNIDSVAQWEGLLWLRGHPDRSWDAADVARHLYISEGETAVLLNGLAERHILAVEDGKLYRYAPEKPETDALIGVCADLYRQYLIPVTKIIHSKPKRVQAFADAFRIRKD
ncbi:MULTISPECIES: hypothetical protein [Asticcacaulis]|uniref:hypothetical protein n=1 Tax=Asticcacaulis TaxID=76890 RepID=UPI001AE262C9|nr:MULTISPECIES: hypothetical protein [Asticcacaulis]MBP2161113.1 hypothetical protein [Asticcacaulis solisilvae]MDR6802158.1 hypothetical protein [Asticcacaulis sp. BE141]